MQQEQRLPVIQKPKTKKRSRSSKRLLLFLFLFFITLLCILFFQSSLSKISAIEVEGQELLTADAIEQASGVKAGDHFFAVSSSNVEQQVKALKMVESATVTKHFPGVIHIEVKEYPRVAYQFGNANQPEAILADGSVIPMSGDFKFIMDKPILTGWGNSLELKLQLCKALASAPESTLTDISEIKPDPSSSYPDRIKMYTRSQFEVVTTIGYLPEKLQYLDSYISNLKENKVNTGVLTLLEVDTHAPFEVDGNKGQNQNQNQNPKDNKSDKKTTSNAQSGSTDSKKDPVKPASGKETTRN